MHTPQNRFMIKCTDYSLFSKMLPEGDCSKIAMAAYPKQYRS